MLAHDMPNIIPSNHVAQVKRQPTISWTESREHKNKFEFIIKFYYSIIIQFLFNLIIKFYYSITILLEGY